MQVTDLATKETVDIQDLVNELNNADSADEKEQTRFGIETKLDCYYRAALKLYSDSSGFNIAQVSFMPGLGRRLLHELQDRIFPYIHEMSTNAHVTAEVIRALTRIIPGGYVDKQFVRDFMGFVVLDGIS